MRRRPPRSTGTHTRLPYATLCRSAGGDYGDGGRGRLRQPAPARARRPAEMQSGGVDAGPQGGGEEREGEQGQQQRLDQQPQRGAIEDGGKGAKGGGKDHGSEIGRASCREEECQSG